MKHFFGKHVTIVMLLLCCMTANAQFSYDYLKTADKYYAQGDYYNASLYYEKYLDAAGKKNNAKGFDPYVVPEQKGSSIKASTHQQAVYKLAESYRQLNNYAKAAPIYKQTLNYDSTKFPYRYYWYGVSLRANHDFEEAEEAFNTFIKTDTTQSDYTKNARKEIANLQFIQQQLAIKKPKLEAGKLSLNTTGASYAPVVTKDQLVFTSTRPDSTTVTTAKGSPYNNKLYQAKFNSTTVTKTNIPNELPYQFGVATVSADGRKIFFTKWQTIDGKKSAAIYTSDKTDTAWSAPKLADASINAAGYNAQQPFLTTDGKYLVFASDKPGGYGKFDLWYVVLDAAYNSVGNAVNLGAVINTTEDDQAPYYSNNKSTLIYASNGKVGMGGFDLYQSKGSFTTAWQEPVNMGYPANSIKDDIYFTSKNNESITDGYFSSDRASECCLELFSLKKIHVDKFITGKAVDCNSKAVLSNVSVMVTDSATNTVMYRLNTDAAGNYAFNIADYKALLLQGDKQGYTGSVLQINGPVDIESDTLYNADLCLTLIPHDSVPAVDTVKSRIVLNVVHFDFDKHNLTKEAKKILDEVTDIMNRNPNMVLEVNGHTDSEGTDIYNLDLSIARAKACAYYLMSKGIKASRLQLKGSGESEPVAPNKSPDGKDNPEGRKENRRTEFKIMHD